MPSLDLSNSLLKHLFDSRGMQAKQQGNLYILSAVKKGRIYSYAAKEISVAILGLCYEMDRREENGKLSKPEGK